MTTVEESRTAAPGTDREFWRGVLAGGGFTAIPRWTLHPAPGVARYEAPIPGDLLAALRQRAAEVGVPLGSVLLAAHAKVLAALSGEPEVVTGYLAAPRGLPLPCRLRIPPGSWRAILLETHRAEWELLSHQDFGVGDLLGELGLPGPAFEIVFDSVGGEGTLAPDTVLWVGIWPHRGRLVLRLRYRTDVLDADAAARIAGYHLAALALIAADTDAEHGRQSLLSAEELRFQLEGLAGPRRELPDRRAHELFEQRVRAHPDAIAAVHGDRQWTYAELNARANQLGRALLARGLRREGVVAVVTERNLDWMAAVLAIFKAGGVYLPIEPHFPAGRIAVTLSRAGCELVLTEAGSTVTLGRALDALPGVQALFVEAAYAEHHADGDLGVAVAAGQLAYIYFTSGSTGEPKGAMCEHAGMLNHLYAKIEDLGISAGQVVAQVAPQCFDISLWQLISGLLAGGRTLLVEQEVILDAARFLDTIEQAGGTGPVTVYDDAGQLIRASDLVVFATIASEPHVSDPSWFKHNPLVLHVSLRDLTPQILLASTSIVDDVDHCLKADTSPHLAEQLTGSRDFLAGTLDDVMAGRVTIPPDRPVVFSPFGLGVLDLAVGKYVYDQIASSGKLHVIDDFFHELSRYG